MKKFITANSDSINPDLERDMMLRIDYIQDTLYDVSTGVYDKISGKNKQRLDTIIKSIYNSCSQIEDLLK
jgi:hypothetical protein